MRLRLLAAIALFLSFGIARADTLVPFKLHIDFVNGGTLSGIVNLDPVLYGLSSTADLTYSSPYGGQYGIYGTSTSAGTGGGAYLIQFNARYPGLEIAFTNFTTGGLCTGYSGCGQYTYILDGNFVNAASGFFVPYVPEPSSIALLSTGLIGITGVIRKRLA